MQEVPAAHTGFLNRARGVPIHQLHNLAKKMNKRLVLTGASLVLFQCMAMALHMLSDVIICDAQQPFLLLFAQNSIASLYLVQSVQLADVCIHGG